MKTNIAPWIILLALAAVGIPTLAFTYWLGYRHGRSTVATPPSEAPLVAGLSQAQVLQMLPGKTWYKHWETKDRNRPTTFGVDGAGRIFVDGAGKEWSLELRWILNEGEHMFIPIDEYKLQGFFIPSGRQKGMFADRPQ